MKGACLMKMHLIWSFKLDELAKSFEEILAEHIAKFQCLTKSTGKNIKKKFKEIVHTCKQTWIIQVLYLKKEFS